MQDELLFENMFTPTLKSCREFVSCVPKVTRVYRMAFIVGAIFVIPAFIALLNLEWIGVAVYLLNATIIFLLGRIAKPLSLANRLISQEEKRGLNAFRERRTQFYEDRFVLDDRIFAYGEISKVIIADICVYMKMEGQTVVRLKKDGFITGDLPTFVTFIEQRPEMQAKKIKTYSEKRNRITWGIVIGAIFLLGIILIFWGAEDFFHSGRESFNATFT